MGRAVAVASEMSGHQCTFAVQSLQALGVHDEAVFGPLLDRAAEASETLTPTQLSVLMAGHISYRLPFSEQQATPLLARLTDVQNNFSSDQRQRIATTLRKTTLPRH